MPGFDIPSKGQFLLDNVSDDYVLLVLFSSKLEKNNFEPKEAPSTNIFATPLRISPSALNLPFQFYVCPYNLFQLSFPLLFLKSFFYFASTNSIYFDFILQLSSCVLCSSFGRRHPAFCLAPHPPPSLFLVSCPFTSNLTISFYTPHYNL